MQALYAAGLGLKIQQERVGIIGHNMANVNTTGFKGQRMDFKDALYTELINPADTSSTDNLQQGTGVLAAATTRDFTAGKPIHTGNMLDLYLEGSGFFTVTDSSGEAMYTRCGCFGISNEADGRYLVTPEGYYVMDENNDRIRLPQGISQITVGEDGVISDTDGNDIAALRIVDFANKGGLLSQGDGCYIETEVSGALVPSQARVKQGVLEGANVDLGTEFSRLIRAQRAFSLAGRAVSIWDQMAANANNLR